MEQVKNIYDRLFEFEKNKKQGKAYPIHKPLRFGKAEKSLGITDISDMIIHALALDTDLHVLDAGCGVGYSLLKLGKYPQVSGLGISLSEQELQMARDSAKKEGWENRFHFERKSYDEDLEGKFEVIICIESLKHSPDWKNTLANLYDHLKADGSLFLVEDFYTENQSSSLVKKFQKSWSVPDMFTADDLSKTTTSLGFELRKKTILDQFIIQKNATKNWITQQLLGGILVFLPKSQLRTLLEIYRGVILMDYFYAKGSLSYQFLHLQKKE